MKPLLVLSMLLMLLSLGACETMEGLGKDIQSLGESIEDSASNSDDDEQKD